MVYTPFVFVHYNYLPLARDKETSCSLFVFTACAGVPFGFVKGRGGGFTWRAAHLHSGRVGWGGGTDREEVRRSG